MAKASGKSPAGALTPGHSARNAQFSPSCTLATLIALTTNLPVAADEDIGKRADELLTKMTLEEKIGQVIQPDINSVTPEDSKVFFGIVGDRDAVPDLDVLAQCIEDALVELVETIDKRRTHAPRGRQRPEKS